MDSFTKYSIPNYYPDQVFPVASLSKIINQNVSTHLRGWPEQPFAASQSSPSGWHEYGGSWLFKKSWNEIMGCNVYVKPSDPHFNCRWFIWKLNSPNLFSLNWCEFPHICCKMSNIFVGGFVFATGKASLWLASDRNQHLYFGVLNCLVLVSLVSWLIHSFNHTPRSIFRWLPAAGKIHHKIQVLIQSFQTSTLGSESSLCLQKN